MPAIPQEELSTGRKPLQVLVTGFGPFAHYEENPSWLGVKPLQNALLYTPKTSETTEPEFPHPIQVTALQVPVTYDAVLSTIPGIHARPPSIPSLDATAASPPADGYDFVFHVGVAGKGPRLEKLAHKTGYDEAQDVDGKYAPIVKDSSGRITRGFAKGYENFDEILRTDIDVDGLVENLKKKGIQSMYPYEDPGNYLCDFIYYCSLAEAKRTADKVAHQAGVSSKHTRVLFFHCPPIGQPLTTPEVTDAIVKTIAWVCSEH
ncbi:peptidase C15 family protein [Abortiporus biennis]